MSEKFATTSWLIFMASRNNASMDGKGERQRERQKIRRRRRRG
jgi:hypothetical protein